MKKLKLKAAFLGEVLTRDELKKVLGGAGSGGSWGEGVGCVSQCISDVCGPSYPGHESDWANCAANYSAMCHSACSS